MPASWKHQGLTKLLSECPDLWPILFQRALGIELCPSRKRVPAPETIRELPFPEHAADVALGLRRSDGVLEEVFAKEIQLRPDRDKLWSWPIHVAGLRARFECPTTLVVLATNERTARWASKTIDMGRGQMTLRPLVIGPRQIPTVLDLAEAQRHPEWATLVVMIHGRKPGSKCLGRVALQAALEVLDRSTKRGTLLLELIAASLGAKTLQEIEDEMEIGADICFTKIGRRKFAEGRARGQQEGLAKGRLEGRRLAIALVLRSRGLELTAAQRKRIERCADDEMLEAWLQRAAIVDQVGQLFRRSPGCSSDQGRRRGSSAARGPTG